MSSPQKKKDKERFFSNLERLCESESESEVEVTTSSINLDTISSQIVFQYQNSSKPKPCKEDTRKNICKVAQGPMDRKPGNFGDDTECHASDASLFQSVQARLTSVKPKPVLSSVVNMKRQYADESASTNTAKKRTKGELKVVPEEKRIFQGFVFFFVPNDEIAKPRKWRIQKAKEYGAQWAAAFNKTVTHVIVEPHIGYTEAAKAFPEHHIPDGTILVKTTWLSESIGAMYVRDPSQSRFHVEGAPLSVKARRPLDPGSPVAHREKTPLQKADKTYEESKITQDAASNELEQTIACVKDAGLVPLELELEETSSFSSTVSETTFDSDVRLEDDGPSYLQPQANLGFQCMESHDGKNDGSPNSETIAVLQEMAIYYDRTGDNWRTTAYRKAIAALRKQETLIATREQALAIPQIGGRLAEKVEEIVTTHRLRRLESTKDDPYVEILQLFMGIYDVGYKQASLWIAQGHRTLSDLLESAKLSTNQRVGIDHYDDFLQRIPRDEVARHASIVQHACHTADKDLQLIIGGSYRRGNADSGDIDLIITKPNANLSHIRTLLTSHVIPLLTSSGFLKCALVSSQARSGTGSKWHGASCLPTSKTWRRLDLLYVPWDELGAALLYFTGNDIFNRSVRLLASNKGMRLNQHGLYKDVLRGKGRVKITGGTLLEGKSEKRIFEILGVPWREPWERKC